LSPEQNTRLGYWWRQKLQSEQEDYISLLYEQSGGTNLHKTADVSFIVQCYQMSAYAV